MYIAKVYELHKIASDAIIGAGEFDGGFVEGHFRIRPLATGSGDIGANGLKFITGAWLKAVWPTCAHVAKQALLKWRVVVELLNSQFDEV